MKKIKVKRTERGWAGHFCCADRCLFRRNTLLECGKKKIIVSTVGKIIIDKKIGIEPLHNDGTYFETCVFNGFEFEEGYVDVVVTGQLYEKREKSSEDIEGNNMHEKVVKKFSRKLERGGEE